MLIKSYLQYFLGYSAPLTQAPPSLYHKTCVVQPAPDTSDSAPSIQAAFRECGHNLPETRSRILFPRDQIYHINTFMDTTGLSNVDIELLGTLLWSTNISYWLSHSRPVGYQNQSTAWWFGGEGVRWWGDGVGTLDGNGQVWYDFIDGASNYQGRPHAITIKDTRDSVFEGLRFVQSQMWTMTLIHSENVLLQDIYVNSSSNHPISTSNTDGADTIYSNNITFRRWTIYNGDDAIALKANSTNILIEDCEFYHGVGLAIGSIGQYNNTYETIQNVTARNITTHNTDWGAYIKTWTGVQKGYPPNGGGGGLGFVANLTFEHFNLDATRGVFAITQCTNYEGRDGDCDTSEFNVHGVTVSDWQGSTLTDVVGSLQCSGASPCRGIAIEDVDLVHVDTGAIPSEYLCDSVEAPTVGFACTGVVVEDDDA